MGVGRGNVDGDVVGIRIGFFQANQVVIRRVFDRGGGVFADVDAQNALAAAAFDVAYHRVDAVVVKAHAVDDGLVFGQAEQAWFGVAVLRLGGDGADFDKAEAECEQGIDVFAVFVEAGGEADRVGQVQAHQRGGQADGGGGGQQLVLLRFLQRVQCEVVGLLGIEAEQQRADKGIHNRPV